MSIAQHESMQKILRHYIEEKDCEKLLELLVVHPTLKDDALALAAGWGNLEIVEAVLDKGADVNGMHMGTVTPLYLACQYGEIEIARLLIASGAGVTGLQYKNRYSPLYGAAACGYMETVKLLCENGANVHMKDTFMHRTALFAAHTNGHCEIVDYLLSMGGEEVDACCICLENLDKKTIVLNGCTHQFHERCIVKLLGRGSHECPLCRASFSEAYNEAMSARVVR